MTLKNKLRKRAIQEPRDDYSAAQGQPAVPVYETVADTLRQAREGYELELTEVAEALNIRQVYLAAIESGHFDELPGTTYAVGFVRAYAEYLGFDGAQIVYRFKEEAKGLEQHTKLSFPAPVPESRLPSGTLILVSLLCLALAYGGWTYLSNRDQDVAELVPEVPDRLRPLIADTVSEPAAARTTTAEAQADVRPALSAAVAVDQPSPSQDDAALDGTPLETVPSDAEQDVPTDLAASPQAAPDTNEPVPVVEVAQIAALDGAIPDAPPSPEIVEPASSGAEQTLGAENTDSRVTLKASQDSWVQVRDQQDTLLLARILHAGESYRVPNQPGITLVTGNAGGLEILVDGTSIGTMGPVGSVLRDVSLDPQRLVSPSVQIN